MTRRDLILGHLGAVAAAAALVLALAAIAVPVARWFGAA